MDNIKDLVTKVVEEISCKQGLARGNLEKNILDLLTPQEREHLKVDGVKNGDVFIVVDVPSWLYQISAKKNKLLKRLKEENPDIRNLYLKIGKVK